MKRKRTLLTMLLVLSLCLSATIPQTTEAANKKTTTTKKTVKKKAAKKKTTKKKTSKKTAKKTSKKMTTKKAAPKIKSVTVKMNGKKLTKKTITLTTGQKVRLTASVSPAKAATEIHYTTNIKDCDWNMAADLFTNGELRANHKGTTRIFVEVYRYDERIKQIPFTVKVVDPKPKKTETNKATIKHTHTWSAHTVSEKIINEDGSWELKFHTDYYTCTCGAKLNVK